MRTARTAAGPVVAGAGAVLLLLPLSGTPAALAAPAPAPAAAAAPGAGERWVVRVPGPHGPVFRSTARPPADGGARSLGAAERDTRVSTAPVPLPPPQQWALNRVPFAKAWSVSRGKGVVVGVIDSGVDASLPSLAGRVLPGWTFQGAGHEDHAGQRDRVGHGTHVAGILAADPGAHGVSGAAPGVQVLPVSVLDEQGSGWSSDVANGIVYAVDHGARVLNLSFGSPSPSLAVRAAVQYAQDKGVVLVAAAGNDGPDGAYDYPASYPGVIGVGAVDPGDRAAAFSTTGPVVDLVAPGVSVLSTVPRALDRSGTALRTGTSMAAPYVAAAAALVRAASPALTNDQVAERLLSSAEDLGPAGRDDVYGAGLVDPAAAVGAGRATLPVRLPAPSGLRLSVLKDDSVGLSWDAVPGAHGYAVLFQGLPLNLGAEEGEAPVYGLHGTDAHFPQFPRGTPAPLQVVAIDAAGLWSPPSAVYRAVVEARPLAAPQHVRASAPGSRTVRLSWAAVRVKGVTGYGVVRDGAAYQSVDADQTTFLDSPDSAGSDAPSNGIRHTYRVLAFTDEVTSDPSAAVTATPYAAWATSAPTLRTHRGAGQVRVGWTAAVPAQTGWRVYVDGRLDAELPAPARGTTIRTPGRHTVTVVRFRTRADQGPRASTQVQIPSAPASAR